MACFVVPATEAIVTTIVSKVVKSKEKNGAIPDTHSEESIKLSKKIKWLSNLLWGGSGLLAFEHLWHGEIQPFFPFLTSASNPEDMAVAFNEMATVGTSMAVLCTAVWGVSLLAVKAIQKHKPAVVEGESL